MSRPVAGYSVALFVLCLANAPVATQQPQPAQAPAAPATAAEVTIVGCLVRTDSSAHRPGTSYSSTNGKGGSPALANGGAGSGLALKDAAVVTKHEAASTPAEEKAAGHAGLQEFRALSGEAKPKLDEHVGTEVEVQGRLLGADASRLNIGGNAISIERIQTIRKNCEGR